MVRAKKSTSAAPHQQTEKLAERIAELSRLEDEWLQDRARGDCQSSDRLIDDNYRGCNSDGLVQSKADFLAAIRFHYREGAHVEHADRGIQLIGDVALSHGIANIRHAGGQFSFRYLRILVHRAGEWRLITSQSTRIGRAK